MIVIRWRGGAWPPEGQYTAEDNGVDLPAVDRLRTVESYWIVPGTFDRATAIMIEAIDNGDGTMTMRQRDV